METQKLPYLYSKNAEVLVASLAERHLIIVVVNGLRLKFRDGDLFLDFVYSHVLQDVDISIEPYRQGMWVKVHQRAVERI